VHRNRLLALAIAAATYALATACSENLPEGRACPALCPNQSIQVHDTVIDGLTALAVDTTIAGYPLLGTEPQLLVAASGDTLDIRGIIRYDSIPFEFRSTSGDTLQPAAHVFKASVFLTFDTTSFRPQGPTAAPATISVYDVDTTGADTSVAVLSSLFRPDRLLGFQTVNITLDTLRIGLDTGRIRSHVTGDHNVRLGLRITQTGVGPPNARLNVLSAGSSSQPIFSYSADTDTVTVTPFSIVPRSTSPVGDSVLAQHLLNYPLVVAGTSPPVTQNLDVGGMPARRVMVRFALPSRIIDSSTVVRATLTLHTVPVGLRGFFLSPPDSLGILTEGLISTPTVTDPGHAAGYIAPPTVVGIDTNYFGPSFPDSVNIEFVNAVHHWKGRGADTVSRAIVLVAKLEGANPLVASFFSARPGVPATERPHIHLAYVNQVGFGLP
jgi:hypothetical protein